MVVEKNVRITERIFDNHYKQNSHLDLSFEIGDGVAKLRNIIFNRGGGHP